jgi:outer membrane protein assembly factor BamD (BamD/ComL family)
MIALLGMSLADLLCWLIVIPTLVIVTCRALIHSDDRRTLLAKLFFSFLLILSMFWIGSMHAAAKPLWLIIPCALLGTMWVSNALDVLVKPFTATFDGGTDEVEAKPFYYIAEGKRRKGLYEEAVAEVGKQLDKFPGDVEGMMKLAAIQAEDLHDLPAAAATLDELLQQPDLLPNHAVAALQTLADWQMNLGRDPAAARASFERIMQMFPGSSFSHTAEQRIAHLEGVTQTRHLRENAVFKVPLGEGGLGLRKTAGQAESPAVAAEAMAAEYVAQLEKYPNDTDTREKLALLYAEGFERLDLAVSQLEQLAAQPNETPQHIAHWLGLLATVQIRHGHDMEAAEDALRRIIDRFPKSAIATRAVARLATLQAELKAATTITAAKTLGVYEKDVGLKSGPSF